MQVLSGRRHRVSELAFSHCGRWLAASGSYGGVHVWDTANPTAKPLCPIERRHVCALAFRTDGRLFFQVTGGKWHLFDPGEDELKALNSPRDASVVAAPDARHVVRVHSAGPVSVWHFSSKDEPVRHRGVSSSGSSIVAAAFAPDGSTFAIAARSYADRYWQPEVALSVREVSTGKEVAELTGAAGTTSDLRYSGDGAHLLAFWGGSVACWTVAEPEKAPRKAVNPGRKHFLSMAVHPNGHVLTVDNDRLVRVWDSPALATDRTIEWNIGKLHAVAVSPDGTRAAVGSGTGKVLVWDWD